MMMNSKAWSRIFMTRSRRCSRLMAFTSSISMTARSGPEVMILRKSSRVSIMAGLMFS